ncbi:putative alpha/Beta hydrolase [Helianthus anomalus]
MVSAFINNHHALFIIFSCYFLHVSLYFRYCGLSKSVVDLDDNQTTMHIWNPTNRYCNKPNLVLIHGFGGNSKWQFLFQVRQLSNNTSVIK